MNKKIKKYIFIFIALLLCILFIIFFNSNENFDNQLDNQLDYSSYNDSDIPFQEKYTKTENDVDVDAAYYRDEKNYTTEILFKVDNSKKLKMKTNTIPPLPSMLPSTMPVMVEIPSMMPPITS